MIPPFYEWFTTWLLLFCRSFHPLKVIFDNANLPKKRDTVVTVSKYKIITAISKTHLLGQNGFQPFHEWKGFHEFFGWSDLMVFKSPLFWLTQMVLHSSGTVTLLFGNLHKSATHKHLVWLSPEHWSMMSVSTFADPLSQLWLTWPKSLP